MAGSSCITVTESLGKCTVGWAEPLISLNFWALIVHIINNLCGLCGKTLKSWSVLLIQWKKTYFCTSQLKGLAIFDKICTK